MYIYYPFSLQVETIIIFYILLFLVAFLYSSVGHGGASGYLALMAIFSIAPEVMKPTALLLNLFVSLTSFIQFYRGKHFNWKIFLPFAITSVPMAYVGGLITVDDHIYKKILGVLLIIPIIRFLFFANIKVEELKKSNLFLSLLIGAAIGFLSGLIGIGGGIILSPVLPQSSSISKNSTRSILTSLRVRASHQSQITNHLTDTPRTIPDSPTSKRQPPDPSAPPPPSRRRSPPPARVRLR